MVKLAKDPEIKGAKLLLRYTLGVEVEVGRITRDYAKSPQAEVVIDVDSSHAPERPARVFRGRLGLLSRSGIKGCVDTCKRRVPGLPWDDLIDDVCDKTMNSQRTRLAPKIVGLKEPTKDRPAYQVYPLLPSRQPTIIYGQGGIGKSWLGLYLCALVDNGITVNGLNADVGNSLYVDWETDRDTLEGRAWAIKRGEPQIADGWGLRYQEAQGPLVDWIDDLAAHVDGGQFDLVVIDSVGMALGGDASDAETVLAFFRALRQLQTTTLLIDHMTKGPDSQDRGAFGSVYKRNSARSLWEMRQAADGELTMGLYHRKANKSRLLDTLGLSLEIVEDDDHTVQTASFSRCDVADLPDDLAGGMTMPQRIKAALVGGARSTDAIHEALGDASPASVNAILAKMVNRGQIVRPEKGSYGLAYEHGK